MHFLFNKIYSLASDFYPACSLIIPSWCVLWAAPHLSSSNRIRVKWLHSPLMDCRTALTEDHSEISGGKMKQSWTVLNTFSNSDKFWQIWTSSYHSEHACIKLHKWELFLAAASPSLETRHQYSKIGQGTTQAIVAVTSITDTDDTMYVPYQDRHCMSHCAVHWLIFQAPMKSLILLEYHWLIVDH